MVQSFPLRFDHFGVCNGIAVLLTEPCFQCVLDGSSLACAVDRNVVEMVESWLGFSQPSVLFVDPNGSISHSLDCVTRFSFLPVNALLVYVYLERLQFNRTHLPCSSSLGRAASRLDVPVR